MTRTSSNSSPNTGDKKSPAGGDKQPPAKKMHQKNILKVELK